MCGHHRDRHVLTHSFPTRRSSDLRFLCISCTNLDEFFEIRAATVRHAQDFEMPPAPDGLPPAVVLRRIHERAAELVEAQYACWNRVLRPALSEAGVRVLARHHWTPAQAEWLRRHFCDEILPVLSPLGLDPAHPFPKILNKSLNIVVVLEGKDAFGRAGHLAIVRAPRSEEHKSEIQSLMRNSYDVFCLNKKTKNITY